MKKYFLIAIILAFTAKINAQSNLIFNQVINESLPIGAQLTVPGGKVWKITMMNNNVVINGVETYWNIHKITTPVWLGEGDIIEGITSPTAILSIIEFNVVPTSTTTGGSGGGVSTDGLVFEEAITQTLIATNELNSNTYLYGQIVVPENRILKITSISTYSLSTVTGGTGNEGNGWVYIGDELFFGAASNYTNFQNRFLPSGTYTAKIHWTVGDMPNRLVVNAILYSKP